MSPRYSINRNSFQHSNIVSFHVESFCSRSGATGCFVTAPFGIHHHLARTIESGKSFNNFFTFPSFSI